jgi:hypothetical protein
MKPRTLHATKILAVAFTAAGCAQGAATKPTAEPIRADAPAALASAAATATVAGAAATPPSAPPERPMSKDPALLALADELSRTEHERALAMLPHFRPLCDADGYPVVGNVNNKGTRTEPSTFCADVRARAAR